ncbi:MAG: hypothetical protein ACLQDV_02585 [Candidatus Binataceae bacterium]
MITTTKIVRVAILPAAIMLGCAGCTPSAPPEPPPAPVPVAVASPSPAVNRSPDQDWNIFPDPTTGTIDIYHKGEYLGVITGNEPADQDPPLPHKPVDPGFDQ